jgi:hypothetical protein
MPRFDWTARDRAGRNLSGMLDASSKEAVVSQLQAQGLIITNVEPAASARSGTVDFAARLDAHSTAAVDYTSRLKPPAPKRRPFSAFAVSLIFGAMGVAILRAAGWPPPVAPAIVAAVFLLLCLAMLAMLIIGLLMPARMAAAVGTLKSRAEDSRRQR